MQHKHHTSKKMQCTSETFSVTKQNLCCEMTFTMGAPGWQEDERSRYQGLLFFLQSRMNCFHSNNLAPEEVDEADV